MNGVATIGWLLQAIVGPQKRLGSMRLGSVKTAPAFVPTGRLGFEEEMAEFDRLQNLLLAFVQEAEGLPIDQVRVESPFDRRVRYNLYAAFVIIGRHQLRHVTHSEELWTERLKQATP